MDSSAPSEITRMLTAWREGDGEALARLTPLVYGELHGLAKLTCPENGRGTFCNRALW